MDINLIAGNIVALAGSALMVVCGLLKNKKQLIFVQTIQILLLVISNIILGGITGAIINAISCIRNILCYKDKLSIPVKLIIIVTSVGLSLYLNNLAFIGLLPVISAILYTTWMDIDDIVKFKILIIVTLTLWLIYDLYIRSYSSALFDFASIIASIIAIYQIIKKQKRDTKKINKIEEKK